MKGKVIVDVFGHDDFFLREAERWQFRGVIGLITVSIDELRRAQARLDRDLWRRTILGMFPRPPQMKDAVLMGAIVQLCGHLCWRCEERCIPWGGLPCP